MGDKNEPDLGGLNIGSAPTSGAAESTTPLSASEEIITGRKKRSDAGQPRGTRKTANDKGVSALPLTQSQFEKLYDPEIWGRVLASPGDAAAAITGSKTWEISESERKTLGATGSIAAQCFATTDPRWLAVSLALICITEIYASRVVAYRMEKLKEKNDKK